MRSTLAHAARVAAVAAALLLMIAGASSLSAGTVHAQPLNTGSAHLSVFTVDGAGAVQGCANGDSWCAYCSANATSSVCTELQPTMANGSSLVAGGNHSGNTPVLGVEAGQPVLTSAAPMASMALTAGGAAAGNGGMGAISSGLASPAGVSWQWCSIVGGGAAWVRAGTASSGLSC